MTVTLAPWVGWTLLGIVYFGLGILFAHLTAFACMDVPNRVGPAIATLLMLVAWPLGLALLLLVVLVSRLVWLVLG